MEPRIKESERVKSTSVGLSLRARAFLKAHREFNISALVRDLLDKQIELIDPKYTEVNYEKAIN